MKPDTPRVLAVAALVFAGAVLAGVLSGAIALVLAFFAAFAVATYWLDGEVRAFFRKAPGPSPAASPAAPSSPRTSARGWDATRASPGD